MNSIAQIVKHMAGNMRSRWTDFRTSDGEKPDRHRDSEFEEPPVTREALMRMWEAGWNCLFSALEPLCPGDAARKITIRGEAHSVMQAVNRQITHYAYHVGQIVFLAKHLQHADGNRSAFRAINLPNLTSVWRAVRPASANLVSSGCSGPYHRRLSRFHKNIYLCR